MRDETLATLAVQHCGHPVFRVSSTTWSTTHQAGGTMVWLCERCRARGVTRVESSAPAPAAGIGASS